MGERNYAAMARQEGKEGYFRIVQYMGRRTFSEKEAGKIESHLRQRGYEVDIIECLGKIDLDALLTREMEREHGQVSPQQTQTVILLQRPAKL